MFNNKTYFKEKSRDGKLFKKLFNNSFCGRVCQLAVSSVTEIEVGKTVGWQI